MSKRSRSAAGLSTLDAAIPATPPPPGVPEKAEKTTIVELSAQVEKGCQACLATCAAVDKLPQPVLHAQHAHIFPAEESADVELLVTAVIGSAESWNTWYPGRPEEYKCVEDVFQTHLNFSRAGLSHWRRMIDAMGKSSVEYASFGDNPRSRRNLEALLHNITVLKGHLNALLSDLTSNSAKIELWKSDAHKSAAKAEFVALIDAWSRKYGIATVGAGLPTEPMNVAVQFGVSEVVFKVKPTTLASDLIEATALHYKLALFTFRIYRDLDKLDPHKTLVDNDVVDGDTLHCFMVQVGD